MEERSRYCEHVEKGKVFNMIYVMALKTVTHQQNQSSDNSICANANYADYVVRNHCHCHNSQVSKA